VQFLAGKGMDVRPHPHIGLATVTYLFDGSIMHRDSEGNIQEIQPGAMNLMTAGRASPIPSARPTCRDATAKRCWAAKLDRAACGQEEIARSFQHYAAGDLPMITERGLPRASSRAVRSA
jgi:redox-sensitive bicupin YhaK (pirin superfamily)